jgi:hypothetical protein
VKAIQFPLGGDREENPHPGLFRLLRGSASFDARKHFLGRNRP